MAEVCLTFDNGPDEVGTPLVLDVLARLGVTTTFFVLGQNLARPEGADLARRALEAGHRLGNHTFSHRAPLGSDPRPDAVELELERTEALLDEIVGDSVTPRLFRPVGGGGRLGPHLLSDAASRWLIRGGYTCVTWTSVPGDFRDPIGWVDRGLDDCGAQDQVLMVLHDAAPEAMTRLDRFVRTLLDRGHTLVDRFPDRCLPIVDGEVRLPLERFVTGPTSVL